MCVSIIDFQPFSRLGADEAKRREQLRAAENEAKAAGNGIWAEGGESVSFNGTYPRKRRWKLTQTFNISNVPFRFKCRVTLRHSLTNTG
jgi:hypothetical protein